MTVEEFLRHIKSVSAEDNNSLWSGIGITDFEYKDKDQILNVVFGYNKQQQVSYKLEIDDVFFLSKVNTELPNFEGKLWPEEKAQPFINIYTESRLLNYLYSELGIEIFYGEGLSNIKHYQLTAQNIMLNFVSRGEPKIHIIPIASLAL